MIPKIIHQIWLNDVCSMPKDQIEMCLTWQKHNPEFEYILWDNSAWDMFGGKVYWEKQYSLNAVHPGITSDILRALIVNKFGGVYADTDTECHNNISCLLDTEVLVCYDRENIIMGGFFGGTRANTLTEYILNNLSRQGDLLTRVGCVLFNRSVVKNLDESYIVLGTKRSSEFFTHHYRRSWL